MKRTLACLRKKIHSLHMKLKGGLEDYAGSRITSNWKISTSKTIDNIDDRYIEEVIRMYSDNFGEVNEGKIKKYSKIFNHLFYIITKDADLVGYCIYYIKPSMSFLRFKKIAVLYSIAVDEGYRGQGYAKRLLNQSLDEMRSNNICKISLYVEKKNTAAIQLYNKMGFEIVDEVEDICKKNSDCYKMDLGLQ